MLKVNNLTIKFGGLLAVNDVSLDLLPGKINGLIGPNGAGKTTFFNLISGVYKPTGGKVFFNEKRIDGMPPFRIHEMGISRTYQVINLFKKMSVLENVQIGMHSRLKSGYFASLFRTKKQKREEKNCLEQAYDWLDFVGLRPKAKMNAHELSYGEQRLLEIVRGMASSPKLLLLDEPAAGMNTKEKDALDTLLRRILDKGITIFLVEHDMKLVMGVTDHIFVLNYGKKLAEGTPETIQNDPEVIKAYLGEDEE
jgi:branched-chain amino acid transport system ATP-binding protein